MTTLQVNNVVNRVVIQEDGTSVDITVVKPIIDITTVGTQGIQGVKGDKGDIGAGGLDGYEVVITTPQDGDVIQYMATGSKFVNSAQSNITDGGNF